MKTLSLILTVFFICSCATVDVEQSVRDSSGGRPQTIDDLPVSIQIEPEVVIRERPVFVPEKETSRPQPSGYDAVNNSNMAGIAKPSDYSHAAMIYDYDPDWVYEVYAQPLRACDIVLEAGENVIEAPFVSDSVRWQLGAGVSYQKGTPVQHIYVKPTESGIDASLIINTDRRVYHIILRSFKNVHMPITRWNYYTTTMPNNTIAPPPQKGTDTQSPLGTDPRYLSFNYRITYGWFGGKPRWFPKLVFDDGSKTYITFPESVLNRELPAIFENRKDVVNYRVIDNLIIIDQLVDNITVKIQRTEISISRKNANGK